MYATRHTHRHTYTACINTLHARTQTGSSLRSGALTSQPMPGQASQAAPRPLLPGLQTGPSSHTMLCVALHLAVCAFASLQESCQFPGHYPQCFSFLLKIRSKLPALALRPIPLSHLLLHPSPTPPQPAGLPPALTMPRPFPPQISTLPIPLDSFAFPTNLVMTRFFTYATPLLLCGVLLDHVS